MPRTVPVTIASTLVRERPDIRAAEARLASASAEIGVATASLYPDLTLSGSAGLNGINGPGFGPTLDFIYSAGVGLLAPLFQGGSLRAQRDAHIALAACGLWGKRAQKAEGLLPTHFFGGLSNADWPCREIELGAQ